MTFFIRTPFWLTIYHILSRAARVNRYALLSFMAASPHGWHVASAYHHSPSNPLSPTTTVFHPLVAWAISGAVILNFPSPTLYYTPAR